MWTVAFMPDLRDRRHDRRDAGGSPADFVLHNSLFLIAHFHNVIIGGVVFGMFAGITYWFPKAFGFKLDRFWGTMSFWFWVVGFYFAFMPLYVMGFMGATRRLRHFDDPSMQIWTWIAAFGALLILFGILSFLVQIFVSIRNREALRDLTGDPWNGRTLEWSTASPPPAYNFAFTPVVHDLDAWWDMKKRGLRTAASGLQAYTHAEQYRRGHCAGGAEHDLRFRDDLVHLVAGGVELRRAHRRRDRAHV